MSLFVSRDASKFDAHIYITMTKEERKMRSLYLYLYLKMHLALMGVSLRFEEELEGGRITYNFICICMLVYMLHITLANILVRLWEPDGRRIPALTVDTDTGEEEELRLSARAYLYLYSCI